MLCVCVSCVSVQADVFSFGIMMYEVLQRYIMLSAVAVAGTYEELERYCARVAGGYRPVLHTKWPASVSKLIQVGCTRLACTGSWPPCYSTAQPHSTCLS